MIKGHYIHVYAGLRKWSNNKKIYIFRMLSPYKQTEITFPLDLNKEDEKNNKKKKIYRIKFGGMLLV